MIDLHIHSQYSDGELSIPEIITEIRKKGVTTFSITDHDNLKGLDDIAFCDLQGLRFIPGIEVSALIDGYKVHILGYGIHHDEKFHSFIKQIQKQRQLRLLDMYDKLIHQFFISFSKEEQQKIESLMNSGVSLGKPHLMNILLDKYPNTTYNQLSHTYFAKSLSHVSYRVSAESCIAAIDEVGGIAVLAHPKELEKEYGIDIEPVLMKLKSLGIKGIEAYNSIHTLEEVKRYLQFAQKHQFLISGGSDFHGIHIKPDVEIGGVTKEKIHVKQLSLVDYIT